jgi:S1-C subfamily serine protease
MICGSNRAGGRFAPVVTPDISDRRRPSIAGSRRRIASWTLLVAGFACLGSTEALRAQTAYPMFSAPPRQPTEHLARTVGTRTETPTTITREKSGTAFFVDDFGHMLTAGHAAVDGARLVVAKEGHVVGARVVAVSSQFDVALIQVGRTL